MNSCLRKLSLQKQRVKELDQLLHVYIFYLQLFLETSLSWVGNDYEIL